MAAYAVKKGCPTLRCFFFVALPLHAFLEGLVVSFGITWQGSLIVIAGTAIQHVIDSIISIIVLKAAFPLIKTIKAKRQKENQNKTQ
jgi:hypothetical protein